MRAVQILPGTGRWQTLKAADGGGSPLGAARAESPHHHPLRGRSPSPFRGGAA
jgi:hypothetical protein